MIGVIGATGQVGKELVSILAKQRCDFVALVRDKVRASHVLGENTPMKEFDFTDPLSFNNALHGLKNIFLVINQGENLDIFSKKLVRSAFSRLSLFRALEPTGDPFPY